MRWAAHDSTHVEARSTPRRRINTTAGMMLALAALLVLPQCAAAASIETRIERAIQRSGLAPQTSVYVFDERSGMPIYSHRAGYRSIPASNQKLVTAAAVLHRFGPDHRFTTRLALRGRQQGTTWRGNVYLVGGGDPSLSTRRFGRRNLGSATNFDALWKPLKARGIRRISGKLVVDDSFHDRTRYVSHWPRRFRFNQSPALGGLTVNRSTLGSSIAGPSVSNPALHAGSVLRRQLRSHGIRISQRTTEGRLPADAQVVATLNSPSVRTLVQFMNLASDNFTAEILLKNLGRSVHGVGSTDAGSRAARLQLGLLGLDPAAFTVRDGSGLAYSNSAAPRSLGSLVFAAQHNPNIGPSFYRSLPASGISGTLSGRMKRAPYRGRVRAKTGTLRVASGLTGTAERARTGRRYGFSVITTNWGGVDATRARALQDRVASILVK